jgi:hypothetical protein
VSVSYASGVAGVGPVAEFWARLDLRQARRDVLEILVSIGEAADGWWITGGDGARILVGQRRQDIVSSIRSSPAARFVVDPHAFLRGLSHG